MLGEICVGTILLHGVIIFPLVRSFITCGMVPESLFYSSPSWIGFQRNLGVSYIGCVCLLSRFRFPSVQYSMPQCPGHKKKKPLARIAEIWRQS